MIEILRPLERKEQKNLADERTPLGKPEAAARRQSLAQPPHAADGRALPQRGGLRLDRGPACAGRSRSRRRAARPNRRPGSPGTQAADRGVWRRISCATDGELSEWRSREVRAGLGRVGAALSRHAAQFAGRQRLRPSFGRYFRHPGPACARRGHVGDRGGHGARDRARDRSPRRAAGGVRENHCAVLARQRPGVGPRAGRRRGRSPLEAGDRPVFPPAGVRGRPDRHQDIAKPDTILTGLRVSSLRSANGARSALRFPAAARPTGQT